MQIGTLVYERYLRYVVRKDFLDKVTSEQGPTGSKRTSHVETWGKALQADGTASPRPSKGSVFEGSVASAE